MMIVALIMMYLWAGIAVSITEFQKPYWHNRTEHIGFFIVIFVFLTIAWPIVPLGVVWERFIK